MDTPATQNQTTNIRVHLPCQREYSPNENYSTHLKRKHHNNCHCSTSDRPSSLHLITSSTSSTSLSSSSCSSLSSIVQSSQLVVVEDDMEAVQHEIEDFNQINLNTINSNIATKNSNYCPIMNKATSNSHLNTSNTPLSIAMDALEYSMAQSPLNRRRHTALPQALIMNQQHLSLLENTSHKMDYSMNDLDEYKPILRKALSTPACNIMDIQNPLKSDVTIITNHTLTQQQHSMNTNQQHSNHIISANNNSSIQTSESTTTETKVTSAQSSTTSSTSSLPTERSGCAHYKRSCMFVTPCCNKFYKCRFCHDENESHHFDRKTLTELICTECNTRQKVQDRCQNCGIRFGKYTCLICNLFDDSDKRQYHCRQCGICRIGGRDNFFHCEVCDMCLPIQLKIAGHRCVENISRSHCPVCLGDIHTSRIPCHIPDCGHLLHKLCFDQLLASGHYTCPTCQTSLIDMTALWEYLDAQAELMPIPKKYENQKIHIFCNDCHKTSKTKFHYIGLKCVHCGAYNTTQNVKRRMSLVTDEPTSA
ncbi:ring finger and CHY zinc finger domain containing 1 isoform X2 [Musca autumnalis]|uniref:ring finger and CHY zinc finger domain containing 1 isoform X2 n=1 Tax=Musca autumnalis TaxID=221902 RepID=UPI003CE81942